MASSEIFVLREIGYKGRARIDFFLPSFVSTIYIKVLLLGRTFLPSSLLCCVFFFSSLAPFKMGELLRARE